MFKFRKQKNIAHKEKHPMVAMPTESPVPAEAAIRAAVTNQADLMLDKLLHQTKKYRPLGDDPHWLVPPEYAEQLMRHLRSEVDELEAEVVALQKATVRTEVPSDALMERLAEESADVCNLALMIRERAFQMRDTMREKVVAAKTETD